MKINRNILWCKIFFDELANNNVENAVICPGSRNTPLIIALSENDKIKCHVAVDERSAAFLALGIAKASCKPVVIAVTSGTAVAELYPAIIEAYLQRTPLIVLTADRPVELKDNGANQTINQTNIFANHIRWFFDAGLPEIEFSRLRHIKTIARRAVFYATVRDRGPVHINMPFRTPFEPFEITDEIDQSVYDFFFNQEDYKENLTQNAYVFPKFAEIKSELFDSLIKFKKGLFIVGPDNYSNIFLDNLTFSANLLGFPIVADGASQLRFGIRDKSSLVCNYEAYLQYDPLIKKLKPDIILHFGRNFTSKGLGYFLDKTSSQRIVVNAYGDWVDPHNLSNFVLQTDPSIFAEALRQYLLDKKYDNSINPWKQKWLQADKIAKQTKEKFLKDDLFGFEGKAIPTILETLPHKSSLFVGNSTPIRDLDYFSSELDSEITIFNNRGASGIDGSISTALGIALTGKKTTAIIGDQAFFYDINALGLAKKSQIPLLIILINNNGGGLFENLPVSKIGKGFQEYFVAPMDLNFKQIVEAFGHKYILAENWDKLKENIGKYRWNNLTVIEIKTDAKKSAEIKNKLWQKIIAAIEKNIDKF